MAADYFFNLDGIPGTSTVASYKGQIQVLSFSFGVSNPAPVSAGEGAGKPNFSSFNVMIPVDISSPALYQACAAGTVIKSGVFSGQKPALKGTAPFLQIAFRNLRVESVQDSGSSESPAESASFSFENIQYTYTDRSSSGAPGATKTFTYSVVNNSLG